MLKKQLIVDCILYNSITVSHINNAGKIRIMQLAQIVLGLGFRSSSTYFLGTNYICRLRMIDFGPLLESSSFIRHLLTWNCFYLKELTKSIPVQIQGSKIVKPSPLECKYSSALDHRFAWGKIYPDPGHEHFFSIYNFFFNKIEFLNYYSSCLRLLEC